MSPRRSDETKSESPPPERCGCEEEHTDAEHAGPAPASTAKDPLKGLMPSGEATDRNPPQPRAASSSGGTSAAEDTTRTAGYVADLSITNEPPPGPPVPKDPALLAGADQVPAPPGRGTPSSPPTERRR